MDEELRDGGARRPGRWRRTLGVVALAVAVAVVSSVSTTVVWANHGFPDVPGSSPHHANISWAVGNDITEGFTDGTYRPAQPVSRAQMATFLRRLSAQFTVVSSDSVVPAGLSVWASSATCPSGQRPIAGGVNHGSATAALTHSYPLGSSWSVRIRGDNGTSIAGVEVRVHALCAPAL